MAKNGLIGGVLGIFDGLVFLGESSKKGSKRKHTEKRVTSWKTLFWGNLAISR
jgi:Leu/Phe-tRNA-protein transferase